MNSTKNATDHVDSDPTVGEVWATFTEDQKKAVYNYVEHFLNRKPGPLPAKNKELKSLNNDQRAVFNFLRHNVALAKARKDLKEHELHEEMD